MGILSGFVALINSITGPVQKIIEKKELTEQERIKMTAAIEGYFFDHLKDMSRGNFLQRTITSCLPVFGMWLIGTNYYSMVWHGGEVLPVAWGVG